ncbi:conserved hypothetical protein [metagenome]|uniref:Uncharacterized protein n=1 Tax=metagenome TaxID=256318 RepID=A0A2P2C6M2_9ZZZZ
MAAPPRTDALTPARTSVLRPEPDVATALTTAVAVGFALTSLVVEVVLRAVAEAAPAGASPRRRGSTAVATDRAFGVAWGVAGLTGRALRVGSRVVAPVVAVALEPPLVPRQLQPAHGLDLLARRWRADRPALVQELGRWSNAAAGGVLTEVLSRLDLERQLDTVLREVDVEATVAQLVEVVDLDDVADRVLGGLDLDRVIETALTGVDLDAAAAQAVAAVDLEALVAATVSRLDLAALVVERVDLERVVMSALSRIDLTRIVLEQVDLIGIAEYVVDGIDLPEIIRDSTGSVASEAVRGLRMQGVDADAAVARVVDRVLMRRRSRRTALPQSADAAPPPDPEDGR